MKKEWSRNRWKNRNYRSHGAWSRNFKIENECCKNNKKSKYGIFEGTLNGVEVVIVRSGIGKVNAGICTQILADLFDVTHIINTGIARFSGRTNRYRGYRCFHRCPSAWHGCACIRLSVRRDSTAWNFKFPGGRENGIPCQERVRESQHRSESVLRPGS